MSSSYPDAALTFAVDPRLGPRKIEAPAPRRMITKLPDHPIRQTGFHDLGEEVFLQFALGYTMPTQLPLSCSIA